MGHYKKPHSGSVAYSTRWFDLVSKQGADQREPYYALRMTDYVCVVALTTKADMVLVKQYRPAVEQHTLELPSGHVETNQTPEEAARCELAEETGFASPGLELVGSLFSDTGRNENRMWCYLADSVQPLPAGCVREEGLEVIHVPIDEVYRMIVQGEFNHALHVAAVMLATVQRDHLLASLASARALTGSSGSATVR